MAELSQLSPDHNLKFVQMEELMRKRFSAELEDMVGEDAKARLRKEYMTATVSAAAALDITHVRGLPVSYEPDDQDFAQFVEVVDATTLRLALESLSQDVETVEVKPSARERIKDALGILRHQVDGLDIVASKRKRLHEKIDRFEAELEKERITLTQLAVLSVAILGVVSDLGGAGETVAGTVQIIETIVGTAQIEEDEGCKSRSPLLIEGPK